MPCKAVLKLFVRRGLLEAEEAQAMRQWDHAGGFSVDASVTWFNTNGHLS